MQITLDKVTDSASWCDYVYQEAYQREPDVWRHKDQWEDAENHVLGSLTDEQAQRLEALGIS